MGNYNVMVVIATIIVVFLGYHLRYIFEDVDLKKHKSKIRKFYRTIYLDSQDYFLVFFWRLGMIILFFEIIIGLIIFLIISPYYFIKKLFFFLKI